MNEDHPSKIGLNIVQIIAIVFTGMWAVAHFFIIENPAQKLKKNVEMKRLELEEKKLDAALADAKISKTPISKAIACIQSEHFRKIEGEKEQCMVTLFLFVANKGGNVVLVKNPQRINAYLLKEFKRKEVVPMPDFHDSEYWREVYSGSDYLLKGSIAKDTVNFGSMYFIVEGFPNTYFLVSVEIEADELGEVHQWKTGGALLLGRKEKCKPHEIMKMLRTKG